jgi:hypothetical protein
MEQEAGWPHRRSGGLGEERVLLALEEIKPWNIQPTA